MNDDRIMKVLMMITMMIKIIMIKMIIIMKIMMKDTWPSEPPEIILEESGRTAREVTSPGWAS